MSHLAGLSLQDQKPCAPARISWETTDGTDDTDRGNRIRRPWIQFLVFASVLSVSSVVCIVGPYLVPSLCAATQAASPTECGKMMQLVGQRMC